VIAAWVATAVLAGLAALQVAVAAGRPLGRLVWGGRHEVLPPALRVASAASVALYALFAVVLLRSWEPGAWALAAYFGLGVLVNAASRSRDERRVMTPVAAVLCACAVIVAV
jgi:hypothetical protein